MTRKCKDRHCEGGQVCSEETVDGVCVDCRVDAGICKSFQSCLDQTEDEAAVDDDETNNICVCNSEICPENLLCDLEGDVDGVCNVPYICIEDSDCPFGGLCTDPDGDNDNNTKTFAERVGDNQCSCTPEGCDAYEAEINDGFNYICRRGGALSDDVSDFLSGMCLPNCTSQAIGDYIDPFVCPSGYVCLPRDRPDRDDIEPGLQACYPVDQLVCRAEEGTILDICPQFMGCVGESDLFEVSPYCAPICGLDEENCAHYPCPEDYTGVLTEGGDGICLGNAGGDSYCTCIKRFEQA